MLSEYEQNLSKVVPDIIVMIKQKPQKKLEKIYKKKWEKKQLDKIIFRRLRAHTWVGGGEGETDIKYSDKFLS